MNIEEMGQWGGFLALAAATVRFVVWAFDRYDKRRHERMMVELRAQYQARWGPYALPPISSSGSASRSRSSPVPSDVGRMRESAPATSEPES